MMILARNHDVLPNIRYELHANKYGITIKYMRPKVGGGWYCRDQQGFPWPWTRLT